MHQQKLKYAHLYNVCASAAAAAASSAMYYYYNSRCSSMNPNYSVEVRPWLVYYMNMAHVYPVYGKIAVE